MRLPLDRRTFFAKSAVAVGAIGAASWGDRFGFAEPPKPAIAVTCRDAHLRVTDAKDCWTAMQQLGAQGVESVVEDDLSLPCLFHPEKKYSVATPEGIERLAEDAKSAGRRITALCITNRFDERPDFEVEWCTKVAKAAQALGAKAVRIDVWPHKLSQDEFQTFVVGVLKKIMAATDSTGVGFGIENHGGTTNKPEVLRKLFADVGSPRLGLTLDTGNFYWYGHPLSKLYGMFEEFASRVFHTHCKNIGFPPSEREKTRPMGWEYEKYNCPIDEGDVDFRRIVKILRSVGYSNDLCVEDESLGRYPAAEQPKILAREMQFLKGLL